MKLLARTQPLAKYAIHRCLEVIRQLGYDGVEICLENPDLAPARLDAALVAAVHAQVADLGLAPYSVSYHKDFIHNDTFLRETQEAIRWTPEFGTDLFVLAGTRKRPDDPDEWPRMVDRTGELVRVAEECGVTLAEEFEPGFIVGCTAELLRLFEEVGSPRLAANLDLGHVFLCDPDPLAAIRQVGSRIVHGHVENMAAGVHEHLLPWEGAMDLGAYLRALREVGFAGGLALDLYKHDYEGVSPRCIAYLRGILSEL